MNVFRIQTKAKPLTTIFLILLLCMSIATSSVGFAAWSGSQRQAVLIDEQYTTIAILSGANYEKLLLGERATFIGFDSLKFSDGSKYIGPQSAKATAQQSQYYVSSESNILLGVHVDNSTAITSGTFDILKYNYAFDDHCYSLSVYAVECISVDEGKQYAGSDYLTYNATFKILDDVCSMDAYDLPPYNDTLYLTSDLHTRDGEIPFEAGKTYLIRGEYADYPIGLDRYEKIIDENGQMHLEMVMGRKDDEDELGRSIHMEGDGALITSSISELGIASGTQNFTKEKKQYPNSELCYWTTPEDCWPYYAEYQGSWEDYLASEDGMVWQEEIIPNFEMNHASATVILTDNLGTLYNFNSGDASILEGRTFEANEYKNGDAVCLVSASYAQLNGYTIGDTISLDYYDTGFEQTNYDLGLAYGKQGITISRLPLTANNRMDIQMDYTIVGIYTAPEWTSGQHSFHADTIFAPKASVPEMGAYEGTSLPMLSAVTIQNGSIDAFEAHMAADNKAGAYIYFDQGYSEAAASVLTMIDNAMRLMLVGIAMFVLASMLFLLLFVRRTSSVIRSMRLLGVPKKRTWLECLGTLLIQEIIAVLLGNALAVVLYDRITAQLLSGTPSLSAESVLLCSGVQFGVLVLIGGLWTHTVANRNLMQKR